VGAPMILLYAAREHPDVPADVARGWMGETLALCVEEATPRGIHVTIESLGLQPSVCCRSDHLATICEIAGPGLKLTYDCGNPILGGEDPLASLDRIANRVVHAHFKDWTIVERPVQPDPFTYSGGDGRWFRGAVLGDGMVDLPGALARLQALGFDGHISVEYEGSEEPWPAIERGLRYLRSLAE
jgi:sugar phosphate isomerase/epimerase